ncbi:MAG: ABC transporter ATP-binding protein [Oscillospiraceae bacterium]|nr:ABC transporter ATP-binding protein [Oscillospiraceae bacterium]
MRNLLEVKNVKKLYGKKEAVKGVSFEVGEGEIFALIGPNGAGKTTTLRMISTLIEINGGQITRGGVDVKKSPEKVRELLTYLPDEAGAYKNMTGISYLRFMASLCANSDEEAKKSVEYAEEICSSLGDALYEKIKTYSKGMMRKLLIARAVMTRPKLAILDEPTSGLDIINGLEVRNFIKSLTQSGMSVLLSSHNMLEIDYVSDRVGIIDKGLLYAVGTPKELKEKYNAANLEEVFVQCVKETESKTGKGGETA